jgi:hypothetical protein
MSVSKYLNKNLGAEAFKIVTLYDKYKGGKQTKRLTTRGGVLSKLIDIKGVFEPVGENFIMLGLQDDEAGTQWTRYEPGVFNVDGVPLVITEKDQTELIDMDNPLKQGAKDAANFGKTALLVVGGLLGLILLIQITKK